MMCRSAPSMVKLMTQIRFSSSAPLGEEWGTAPALRVSCHPVPQTARIASEQYLRGLLSIGFLRGGSLLRFLTVATPYTNTSLCCTAVRSAERPSPRRTPRARRGFGTIGIPNPGPDHRTLPPAKGLLVSTSSRPLALRPAAAPWVTTPCTGELVAIVRKFSRTEVTVTAH